jgi:phosphoglycerate dehydrogenase-like enzyme
MSALTIWTNAQFADAPRAQLAQGAQAHRLVFSTQLSASNLDKAAPDPALLEADIALGQPDPDFSLEAKRVRWIHLTTAGYTRYDTPEFRSAFGGRGAQLSTSSGVYDEPCAEHVLAFMLANARQLPASLDAQRTDRAWPYLARRAASRLLLGQRVVLLGFGAIGRRLAELLAPFGMKITAVRRRPASDENVAVVTEDKLTEALAGADHVVNILPENPATIRFVNAPRLAAFKPGAIFYNVGRGTTVDQDALLTALQSGRLGAAYLDVTDPEPLPPAHPLWSAPNCFITPHSAGGHDTEQQRLVQHFLDNLRRFERGDPLSDRVI